MPTSSLPIIASLFLLGCAAVGCSSSDDALASPTAARLQGLAHVYLDFAAAKGTGPATQYELKKHLRNVPEFALQAVGVTSKSPQDLFMSERDQRPFIIHYGIPVRVCSTGAAPLIAQEQLGYDGTRLAVYANGKVECVREAVKNATAAF